MLGWWTLGRASSIGAAAGLLALLLWPFWGEHAETLVWPFAATAAVAGLCGVTILLITAFDIVTHRRGRRMRPVRGFDIVLGLGLILLSLAQLGDAAGQLPA
jgi:multisubunit Na+/H+ antiporter MnhB subunit